MTAWMAMVWTEWLDLPPALPSLVWTQWLAQISWALVVIWAGTGLARNCRPLVRRSLGWILLVWMLLPGPWSPAYWLGLTFRLPSLTTDVWVALALLRSLGPPSWAAGWKPMLAQAFWRWIALGGVVLGYLLLLDTLALIPWQMYRWGFGTLALAILFFLSLLPLLPWALQRTASTGAGPRAGHLQRVQLAIFPVVLLIYVLTRLPVGNVWDALLDPCLWIVLQVQLIRYYGRKLR